MRVTALVLASKSPARLAILREAGIEPVVLVSGVDESVLDSLPPRELALGLAELKCAAVVESLAAGHEVATRVGTDALVIGCDSVLELDGEALGKPYTPEVAIARWRAMRGRRATLWTGHAVHDLAEGHTVSEVAGTEVRFAEVTDAEIEAYVATGEPLHCAGAFTIDGIGGAFVDGIDGDHHNVVGLSLPLARRLVNRLGRPWTTLWNRTS